MPAPIGDLAQWARECGLHFVRLAWVDNTGVLHAQAVSTRRLAELADDGLGVVTGVQAVSTAGGIVPVGHGLGARPCWARSMAICAP